MKTKAERVAEAWETFKETEKPARAVYEATIKPAWDVHKATLEAIEKEN